MKGQLDGDEEIRSLLRAITSLYKFTAPLEAAYGNGQDLDGTLVEVIRQILRQTIGCVLFIQEYSGHGFASALLCIIHIGIIFDGLTRSVYQ